MQKRLKSIDIFRGFDIAFMIFLHMSIWGRKFGSNIYFDLIVNLIDGIGAEGFVFISGLSLCLSYRNQMLTIPGKKSLEYKKFRLMHFMRAFLLFFLGFIQYNLLLTITWGSLEYLWVWNIFQTLAFCMWMIWPLLKANKIIKIGSAIIFLGLYQLLLMLTNQNGPIYYILYNGFLFSPILGYFPFFIFGTLMGDIIYENVLQEETMISNRAFFKKFSIPLLILGGLTIVIIFSIDWECVLEGNSICWLIYSCGIQFVVFNILFMAEKSHYFEFKRDYRFFFYFSYYSLTVFVVHSVVFSYLIGLVSYEFFLFKYFISYFALIIGFFIVLKFAYKKYGKKVSLKYWMSQLARYLVLKFMKEQSIIIED
ncbi:MAG: conserved membrane protein of unknown function [Promethearchaeota archaeon]|nr:MAG: conserved membrane protein of unknown function [Candidatus Lokiarchaeota archaeon]